MFLVLLLFALVKKKKYFKCSKHPNNSQEVATIAHEVVHLKSLMANKSGVDFKVWKAVRDLEMMVLIFLCSSPTPSVTRTRTPTPCWPP